MRNYKLIIKDSLFRYAENDVVCTIWAKINDIKSFCARRIKITNINNNVNYDEYGLNISKTNLDSENILGYIKDNFDKITVIRVEKKVTSIGYEQRYNKCIRIYSKKLVYGEELHYVLKNNCHDNYMIIDGNTYRSKVIIKDGYSAENHYNKKVFNYKSNEKMNNGLSVYKNGCFIQKNGKQVRVINVGFTAYPFSIEIATRKWFIKN